MKSIKLDRYENLFSEIKFRRLKIFLLFEFRSFQEAY